MRQVEQEKEKRKYSNKENIKYLFRNWWEWDKKSIWLCAWRIPALVLMPMLMALIPKVMIDYITQQRPMLDIVLVVAAMSIGIAGLSWVSPFLAGHMETHMEGIQNKYRIMAFNKIMTLSYENVESPVSREKNKRGQNFSTRWYGGARSFFDCVVQLGVNAVGIVSYLALLSMINPLLLLLIFVTCLGDFLLLKGSRKLYSRLREKLTPLWMKYDYFYDKSHDFSAGKDVRSYSLGDWFVSGIALASRTYVKLVAKMTGQMSQISAGQALLAMVRDGVAYIYLIYCVLEQGMSVANFIFYFGLITGFASWMNGISAQLSFLERISVECDKYRDFIETEETGVERGHRALPTVEELPCSIEFKNVCFTYQGATEQVLSNMSFTVQAGENIAIVGENGAGKTTAIKLLCGFYQPTEGQILVNGIDVTEFDKDEYYALFAAVFQDYNFLPMSVASNITLQEESEIDRAKLAAVLEQAGIAKRIEALSRGSDTYMVKEVHEEATDFSGGEVQKLLLARALYKEAPVLVLDEPTAALDPIAENELYERYNTLTKGKTSFFISHRLSSTRFCNRIFFISDRTVSEAGTHEELMAKKGKYWQMFQVQSHYYREGSEA